MDIELTKDADYLLCVLYDAYRQRRKQDVAAFDAKLFGGSEQIQGQYIQDWPTHDIDDAAFALSKKGLIEGLFVEAGELGEFMLTDDAIAYMEHRFKRNADQLLHYMNELLSVLTKFRPS